ncbi:MOSC domain-containing protein [Paenibacillus donghaensis]|uniref:MOSC domain-containing protein n=1 Tax=Paenibacillus donghaensis TaxID=414771 RepID=UPI001883B3FC|nr:MOSC domain-containing protein [Paenibacillus donghaensis]MBE9915620.1 MOSC domain-containing protein [Paenibacillus donghaensis]
MEHEDELLVGQVKEIRRFPVKSILGESLSSVLIDNRGLIGDRLWAIKNMSGKFGSGKTTRRFQQMNGLFNYRARYEGSTPIVTMPDGLDFRGDNKTINEALSEWLGFQVTLAREESIPHFDEGPISIITTSALRMLSQILGEPVDPRRFRANILIDTESTGYNDDDWVGRTVRIGSTVTLKVVAPLQRCVMVNNAQEDLQDDSRILRILSQNHGATFGVWAKVERNGEVNVGDETILR